MIEELLRTAGNLHSIAALVDEMSILTLFLKVEVRIDLIALSLFDYKLYRLLGRDPCRFDSLPRPNCFEELLVVELRRLYPGCVQRDDLETCDTTLAI